MSTTKRDRLNSLYEYMQDFDDSDAPDGAWQARLEESVTDFNDSHGTNYDPLEFFLNYIKWLKFKQDK